MNSPTRPQLLAPRPSDADASSSDPPSAALVAITPIDSAVLLQGGKAVAISHNGELYRLQATRQGKLILTK
jgi:hemin uptake protein HemP